MTATPTATRTATQTPRACGPMPRRSTSTTADGARRERSSVTAASGQPRSSAAASAAHVRPRVGAVDARQAILSRMVGASGRGATSGACGVRRGLPRRSSRTARISRVAVLSLVNVLVVARVLGPDGRGSVAFLTAIAWSHVEPRDVRHPGGEREPRRHRPARRAARSRPTRSLLATRSSARSQPCFLDGPDRGLPRRRAATPRAELRLAHLRCACRS